MHGDERDGGRGRDTDAMRALAGPAYPRIEFHLSPDFWVLSLDGDPDVRARKHRELVDRLLPGAGPEAMDDALGRFADIAASHEAARAAYAANLVGRLGERLTIAHFTLTIEPFVEVDPCVAAEAIAAILRAEPDRLRAVKLVSLPSGPAVATEELRERELTLGQSQVFIKPAGCPGLVVLTMVTPSVQDLTAYTNELAAVAGSLRFRYEDA